MPVNSRLLRSASGAAALSSFCDRYELDLS